MLADIAYAINQEINQQVVKELGQVMQDEKEIFLQIIKEALEQVLHTIVDNELG